MLVLTQKIGGKVHILLPDGRAVIVMLVDIIHDKVRLGFEADRDIKIHRDEHIREGLKPA